MEFEEMKKIWDSQSNQALYAIDESALKKKVLAKQHKAAQIASRGERVMIGALLFAFTIITGASIYKSEYDWVPLSLAGVMLLVAIFIMLRRRKRLSIQNRFENSLIGNIDQALENANYQLKLSYMSRWLYFLVAILSVASVVDTADEWYKGAFLLAFFIVGYFGARWEHKTFYISQKNGLLKMREKLLELESVN